MSPVYMGTILLEPNRWQPGRPPSYRVSEWVERFRLDGFDGMELWENHAACCPPEELARMEASILPVAIFNTYAGMGNGGAPERDRAAELVNRLGAGAVKFNVGNVPQERDEYARNAKAWADRMPSVTRMLCECHGGTLMEKLDVAQAMYEAWGDKRFQAILHAFAGEETQVVDILRQLGPSVVTHVHAALRDHAPETADMVRRRIALLHDMGFAGTFTLEFTEGTGTPGEDRDVMYERALRDLDWIRRELDK